MESLLAISLLAGMLAAFNPCGFAMLPAYLGVQILKQTTDKKGNYLRALKFSFGMGAGLLLTFTAFGLVVIPFASSIQAYLPWVTLVVALLLAATGIAILAGKSVGLTKLFRPSIAPKSGLLSQVGYGVTYALASLSCTIGPFLAVTATAIRSSSWFEIPIIFGAYGFGMSAMVLLLALLTASSSQGAIAWLRRKGKLLEQLIAGFLIVVAIYLFAYGVFELQVAAGNLQPNAVISTAIDLQSYVSRFVYGVGPLWVIVGVVLLSAFAVWGFRKSNRSGSKSKLPTEK
ncbi:cytochrome c biogenesis CcdA family protein [Aquiluna sp. Uisw_065]|uniref:cytochrome c biogenesis CcdA family protein n=1 Tax=Aquiluna sp. Uisw_065 TaxID=3230967 RepID=UPI0039ECA385